jgi:hypothetical protein
LTFGYRIAAGLMLVLCAFVFLASYLGWGLDDDASVRARSVRQGSIRGRHYFGGGPGFGK